MKTITTILSLLEKAKAKAEKSAEGTGYAVVNRRERYYNWGGGVTVGDLKEVYRVEYIKGGLAGDTVNLHHYETHTAEVWLADTPQVLHVYGESRSDADSINTLLHELGAKERYTFRPVNGGFQETEAN